MWPVLVIVNFNSNNMVRVLSLYTIQLRIRLLNNSLGVDPFQLILIHQ